MSFERLRKDNIITCTRQYAHIVFLASLVTLLVIKKRSERSNEAPNPPSSTIDAERWFADLEDDDGPRLTTDDAIQSLHISGEALSWFASHMPDVTTYARLSDALRREIGNVSAVVDVSAGGIRPEANERQDHLNATQLPFRLPSTHGSPQTENMLGANGPGMIQSAAVEGPPGIDTDLSVGGIALDPLTVDAGAVDNLGGQMFQEGGWPFSSVAGMEDFGSGISEYLWDMIPMWEESPSAPLGGHI
ncbi:unnamed protein product [Clonostachys byssicola]|uniref:Uncharacterized protein n=1 Tax=Clonostachys byssicola TaxID=160290 RepID=A0A9N9Y6A1_9HYPO|nr:unnamed protein product [Clonostachys byssicola]